MFTIGIHVKDFRRTTEVLKYNRSEPLDFDFYKQDKDFYIFEFPSLNYDGFKSIVLLLKNNGINALGADEQLSENNIMKLTNILREQEDQEKSNPLETADDIIAELTSILEVWEDKEYESDEARWKEYYMDIENLVTDYKENQSIDRPDTSLQERKLKNLIKTLIKEWQR
tara:strand:+ start:356 stop:865 length:510 start_codon:yes stop_codon:yes gene_type:complete